ncbi:MAG: DUF1552 domain-containing protein [Nannocystaceae bacterium]|nr:DUF1552 domain-containing protein [Nannocystaceae bacterium]
MTLRFNPRFSRRRLLQTMGVSAAAAPFIPLLQSAKGGAEPAPKRFITFFTPHGTIKENWTPTGSVSDFELSPILTPLQAVKDRVVVVEGLDVIVDPDSPLGGPHTTGPAYLFTGSPMMPGSEFQHQNSGGPHGWGSSISIDQAVANQIGQDTAFKSLELGVQTGGAHPGSRISYAGPGQPLAPESNPAAVFAQLFGEAGADAMTKAKRKAERLSVVDIVKDELDSLHGKVNQADRLKIEAHLTGIGQIENWLNAEYDCEEFEIGEVPPPNNTAEAETLVKQQIDILVESMACGITNVGSLMIRRGENDNQPYPFLGDDQLHHATTHAANNDTEARAWMTTVYTWYAEMLAYLAVRLDGIEDPEGGTMLDNTIILWGTEIAQGNNHSWSDMPFVMVGGGGGTVRTERYHQFNGESHCQLLVSCCNAMGLNIDEFGGFDDGSGPLAGILV